MMTCVGSNDPGVSTTQFSEQFQEYSGQDKYAWVAVRVLQVIRNRGAGMDEVLSSVRTYDLLGGKAEKDRLRGVQLLAGLAAQAPLTQAQHQDLLDILKPAFTDPSSIVCQSAFDILFLTGVHSHLAFGAYTCASQLLDHGNSICQAQALNALKGVAVDVDFGAMLLDRVIPYLEDTHPPFVRRSAVDLIKMVGEHEELMPQAHTILLPLTRSPNVHVAQAATTACAELLSLTDPPCSVGLPSSSLRVARP